VLAVKRIIQYYENRQRGCQYCLHVTEVRYGGKYRNACPLAECPYEILEKYNSYEEFMASEDSKIFVTEFFQTVPTVYELSCLSHAPRGIFEDKGDFKMHL
jgi:hypothetical protein